MVLEYHKNDNGEFICQHCQFTARYQSTMHYHLMNHEGALPHCCKVCDHRFLQKSLLDTHMKSKHPETLETKETFKCPFKGCEFESIQKVNCISHFMRIHLKEQTNSLKCKPTDDTCVVSCKACSKNLKSMPSFYSHVSKCVTLTPEHPAYKSLHHLLTVARPIASLQ